MFLLDNISTKFGSKDFNISFALKMDAGWGEMCTFSKKTKKNTKCDRFINVGQNYIIIDLI